MFIGDFFLGIARHRPQASPALALASLGSAGLEGDPHSLLPALLLIPMVAKYDFRSKVSPTSDPKGTGRVPVPVPQVCIAVAVVWPLSLPRRPGEETHKSGSNDYLVTDLSTPNTAVVAQS